MARNLLYLGQSDCQCGNSVAVYLVCGFCYIRLHKIPHFESRSTATRTYLLIMHCWATHAELSDLCVVRKWVWYGNETMCVRTLECGECL